MGVPPNGQVAIAVAQRGVLQNPGGATGQLQGVGAPTQKRGLSRKNFRKEIAARQLNTGTTNTGTTNTGTTNTGNQGNTGGTPTNGNNPVAAQLLLAPTFTPIQANAVLDQANMRIAVPVRQVDGEYILIMQKMGTAGEAAPQAAAAPSAPGVAAPAAEPTPRPSGGAGGAEPAAAPAGELNSPARPSGEAPPASKPETSSTSSSSKAEPTNTGPAKPERRQASDKMDKYGLPEAPQGAIIMTMKQIDEMASMVTWGGQAPITQMMNDYVKAQTGKGLDSPKNGTAAASAAGSLAGITV